MNDIDKEASIEDILDKVDFNKVPLSEIYPIFESDYYEQEECFDLFRGIVDAIDCLSEHLSDLIQLLERFPKLDGWDIEYERLEAFEYLYDAIGRAGLMMETFPEFIEALEKHGYGFGKYSIFNHMIQGIKHTDVIKKYAPLIETEFRKLLHDYYQYPEYPGYSREFNKRYDLYPALTAVIENTDLMQDKVPNFSKLIDAIKDGSGPITTILEDRTGLLDLISLLEGENLSDYQNDHLYWLLDTILDKFIEIRKDDILYNTFSILFEALMRENPTRLKESFFQMFSLLATNISLPKKKFPNIWDSTKYLSNNKPKKIGIKNIAIINRESIKESIVSQKLQKFIHSLFYGIEEHIIDIYLDGISHVKETYTFSESYTKIKDDGTGDEEKYNIFCKIISVSDLSETSNNLINLLEYFSRDYQYIAFLSLYDAILLARNSNYFVIKCPKCQRLLFGWNRQQCGYCDTSLPQKVNIRPTMLMMDKFSDLLNIFEKFDYRKEKYQIFCYMIQRIKGTDIINKYSSLIEFTFTKLLNYFYKLPELKIEEIFLLMCETIKGTKIMNSKFPYFSKLIGVIPYYGYWVFTEHIEKGHLLSLISLLEGQVLMETQYGNLVSIFKDLLDNLYKISKETNLLDAFSLFLEALLQYDHTYVKEIVMDKISLATKNLSTLKIAFPYIMKEYERSFQPNHRRNYIQDQEAKNQEDFSKRKKKADKTSDKKKNQF
jgi:hypothetical protein